MARVLPPSEERTRSCTTSRNRPPAPVLTPARARPHGARPEHPPAATAAALPATADAKGVAALAVCGANGCHPVDRAAVRAGFETFRRAGRADGAADPLHDPRAGARLGRRGSSKVFSLRAGSPARPDPGPTPSARRPEPAPVLAAALRAPRAGSRRTRPRAGSVGDGPPVARVVEVYAPAETAGDADGTRQGTDSTAPIAILAAALGRRRPGRPPSRTPGTAARDARPLTARARRTRRR